MHNNDYLLNYESNDIYGRSRHTPQTANRHSP